MRPRNDQAIAGTLVEAFGLQHLQDARIADLEAAPRQMARAFGHLDRGLLVGDRASVVLQRRQQIGDLAERDQHGLFVARLAGAGAVDRRCALRLQRAAMKDRRGQAGEQVVAAEGVLDEVADPRCALGQRRAQRDVGIEARGGDADRGGGGVQLRLCLEDVGAAMDQR